MERFIVSEPMKMVDIETNLKSSMERFIEENGKDGRKLLKNLKSSMERFIESSLIFAGLRPPI